MIATYIVPVPTSGEGALVDVSALVGPKTVVLTGRFRGIYDLLASHDDSHFVPVLQFDAGGVEGVRQTVSGSFKSLRLRATLPETTPLGAVTCEVSGVESAGNNHFTTLASLAAGFTGETTIVDLAPLFPRPGRDRQGGGLSRRLPTAVMVGDGQDLRDDGGRGRRPPARQRHGEGLTMPCLFQGGELECFTKVVGDWGYATANGSGHQSGYSRGALKQLADDPLAHLEGNFFTGAKVTAGITARFGNPGGNWTYDNIPFLGFMRG